MYSSFTAFFTEVSSRLTLLGQVEGKSNLMFIDSPEVADLLLSSLSTKVCYPILLVEYFDEDTVYHGSGYARELSAGFAVLAPQERQQKGHDHAREVIYQTCKPAGDAIFALLRTRINSGAITDSGKPITLGNTVQGNWVGPLHNDLFGWRIEFTWRTAGAACHNPDIWLPVPEP